MLVLLAAAFGAWRLNSGASTGATTGGAISRIAVLPFRDISGQDKVFSESMHDAVITSIASIDQMGVVPRSEIAARGDNARIRDIAKEFGVNAVLEGTLFRAGDVMRINVQLVEPETVRHFWSGSFEIDVRNVLVAQDSVVKQINAQLRAVLERQKKGIRRMMRYLLAWCGRAGRAVRLLRKAGRMPASRQRRQRRT